jgi:hypothetical protein
VNIEAEHQAMKDPQFNQKKDPQYKKKTTLKRLPNFLKMLSLSLTHAKSDTNTSNFKYCQRGAMSHL